MIDERKQINKTSEILIRLTEPIDKYKISKIINKFIKFKKYSCTIKSILFSKKTLNSLLKL